MLCKLSKSQNSINHKSHCCLMGGKFSITLWTVPLRLINLHSVITLTSTLASLLQSRLEGDLSKKLNKKVCSSSNFLLSSKSQAAGCSSCFGENVFKMGPNPDKPLLLICIWICHIVPHTNFVGSGFVEVGAETTICVTHIVDQQICWRLPYNLLFLQFVESGLS